MKSIEPINVTLARFVGWEHIYFGPAKHHPPGTYSAESWRGMAPGHSKSEDDFPLPIPEFDRDLNAIRLVEGRLSHEQRSYYYEIALPNICGASIHNHSVISAEADERARAILKALQDGSPKPQQ